MDDTLLAYLAGVIDSDGFISIKKSTYHMRVRKDATNPVYMERVGMKQVTPIVPELLYECFGGVLSTQRPSTTHGRELYGWDVTALKAATCVAALLPHLRIKRRQAELVLELRESRTPGYGKLAYWFELEYPDWRNMEMLTNTEARAIMGHSHKASLSQSLANKSILALPYDFTDREYKRFPRLMIERMAALRGKDGHANVMPPQLVQWRDRLYEEIKVLNRIGTGEHPISMRTGYFAMATV